MVRLLLLLLSLGTLTTPLLAQAPVSSAPAPAASTTAQPATESPRDEVLLLFVRTDAAEALQQSAFMNTPGWTIFRETGPLVRKDAPVLYALFPRALSATSASASADVIKAAGTYLAQRGANRLELEPVIDFGTVASSPAPRPGGAPATAPAAAPAADVTSDSIAQGDWQFSGERGLLLLLVKAGKEAQFKGVMETLRSALEKSPDARRREQARGWRVMKVTGNGPSGTIVFLSVLDPVVPGVNYAPSSVFSEALDGEALVRAYSDYADALSSFNLIDLKQVRP